MNKKQTYTSPEVEVFVVQIEDCILTVPSPITLGALQVNGTRQGNVLDASDYGFNDWD